MECLSVLFFQGGRERNNELRELDNAKGEDKLLFPELKNSFLESVYGLASGDEYLDYKLIIYFLPEGALLKFLCTLLNNNMNENVMSVALSANSSIALCPCFLCVLPR